MFILQDETPLFLAAREGSYKAAKILLDHYANREIANHMDQLPRDIAAERRHGDIVQLLDEYRVTSPGAFQMQNGIPTSPNGLHAYMHPHKSKSKQRRNKSNMQTKDHVSYSPDGVKTSGARKTKSKKKSPGIHNNGQNGEISSMGTLSPGEGVSSPNVYDMAPPTYDNVCGQGNMVGLHQMNGIDEVSVNCAQISNRMDDHHVMSNHYKDQHHQMEMMSTAEWLPQGSMSQSPLAMPTSIPTPPSTNSSHNSPIGMDGKHSPMKGKMLPTSPQHYYAMHNRPQNSPHHYHIENYPFEQQQCHMETPTHPSMQQYTGMYDSRPKGSTPMQIQQHVPQYPTPPSQHSYLGTDATPPQLLNALPENILTPSPDSPGHWSSSSPHSAQSDWSEGISSPVPPVGQQPNSKGRTHIAGTTDGAVFI